MVENRDCENIRHLISLELDSEIHDQQRTMLEAHLDQCADCREWERLLQSGLESIDSDFTEVSGELSDLIEENLRTADLADTHVEERVSRHGGGVVASKVSLVLMLLALVLTGVFLNRETQSERFPITVLISGESQFEFEGEISHVSSAIAEIMPLKIGESVTCKEGTARLQDENGFSADIDFNSKVRLNSSRVLEVIQGEARFSLKPGQGPLEVSTEEVRVFVTGTDFLVRRWDKVNRTEVFVLSGEVMVQWGKRIPLPVRTAEWVEVSDRGFMFHSSPEPVHSEGGEPVSRPGAGIGGEQPAQERLFRDIPERTNVGEVKQTPLDMPVKESKEVDPDGEDD